MQSCLCTRAGTEGIRIDRLRTKGDRIYEAFFTVDQLAEATGVCSKVIEEFCERKGAERVLICRPNNGRCEEAWRIVCGPITTGNS